MGTIHQRYSNWATYDRSTTTLLEIKKSEKNKLSQTKPTPDLLRVWSLWQATRVIAWETVVHVGPIGVLSLVWYGHLR
jgi:hypothetical protein